MSGDALRALSAAALVCAAMAVACRHEPPPGTATTPLPSASVAASVAAPIDDTPAPPPVSTPAPPPAPPPDPAQAGTCPSAGAEGSKLGFLVSPLRPLVNKPLRILAATFAGSEELAFRIETVKGEPLEADVVYRGGTPAMTVARLTPKRAGELRVVVGRGGKSLRCVHILVYGSAGPKKIDEAPQDAVWPVTRKWSRAEEALYSAWIREMFHAGRGEDLAFARLDEVTSSPERNVLFDHLGWMEDSSKKALKLKPDCADTPYFMRAYFAWKRRLPFAFRHCSSGNETSTPKCGKPSTVLEPPDVPSKMPDEWNELTQVSRYFLRTLGAVHTGNGRVAFGDDENDFYGVKLTRAALRPGVVFADPYGHVLSLVEFVEPEGSTPGVLYAVDGQPDGSITRKRFWEGNFLWNPDPSLGGSGFKAFRPIVVKQEDGGQIIESLTDIEIAKSADYGDVSGAQAKIDANTFYDTMDRLITPSARDPFAAEEEMVRALSEAAKVRVTSVNNAEPYFAEHADAVIPMPEGVEIFEASGSWEDFSTPSRDFRLLIAMDVVNHFDDKVARQPAAFGAAAGSGKAMDELRERLAKERKRLLASDDLAFTYKRSDGSAKKLTLADLMARAVAFESAYNPNDCAEYRWGAPAGSDEMSTCKRHSPDDQRQRMETYRGWFRERKRPPRGNRSRDRDGG